MKDCRELQAGQRSGETEANDRAAAEETLVCRSGGQSNANYRPPAAEARHPSANHQGGRALGAIGGCPSSSSFPSSASTPNRRRWPMTGEVLSIGRAHSGNVLWASVLHSDPGGGVYVVCVKTGDAPDRGPLKSINGLSAMERFCRGEFDAGEK